MNKKKKIMILSDIAPCTNITSGIVLNHWCDFLLEEGHELYYILVSNKELKMDIPLDKIQKIKFIKFDKPNEGWAYNETSLYYIVKGYIRSFVKNNKVKFKELPNILSQIIKNIRDNDIDILMSSIQGQTITWLTKNLIKKTNIKIIAQTWDPLEWWLKAFKFDIITKHLALNDFKKICKYSDTFMAMSWAMSKEFEKKYGAKCVTNIPSLEKQKYIKNKNTLNKKTYDIALAGQIYAKDEFKLLVEALTELNWHYNDKDIFIHLYGNYFDEIYHNCSNIIIHSHIKQEKLIQELKEMDLLYCPYWFDKNYKKPTRLSFPGKLTTYLKVGKPIFMHGPSYASPLIFVKKFNAAYICESNSINEIIQRLKEIISEKVPDDMLKNANTIFNKYLTKENMKKSLLVSLGLLPYDKNKEIESIREIYGD